jgi:hypothetical protein
METEILRFANQKHRVTFSIPHQKWKVDYNKIIIWMKKNYPFINHDVHRMCGLEKFRQIFSIIKILDHSVIAKLVPAIFIVFSINPKHADSRNLLYDVQELCGNIGNRKLCQLAFEEVWTDEFELARLLWEFSDFKISDERFQVKIAGKNYKSNGLYGLFIPFNSDDYDESIYQFEQKIRMFNPSIDDLHKIRYHLSNMLSRTPGYIDVQIEYKLLEITDEIIKNISSSN